MIRGGSGNFIVIADGERLWHKREMEDEFPRPMVIIDLLRGRS